MNYSDPNLLGFVIRSGGEERIVTTSIVPSKANRMENVSAIATYAPDEKGGLRPSRVLDERVKGSVREPVSGETFLGMPVVARIVAAQLAVGAAPATEAPKGKGK